MRAPVVIATAVVVCAAAAGAWWLSSSKPPAPPPGVKKTESSAAPRSNARGATTAATENKSKALPPFVPLHDPRPPEIPPIEAAPTKATLRIETDVPGASVLIDRLGVGDAPITIRNLTPGPHRVNVIAPGYEGFAENLELEPGTRTLSIKFREIKLDEKLEVVHKHAIGSCKGSLTASPEGVRYSPAEGDHGFSVTLPAVDGIDVDYLATSLRLNAQGRTLNFTPVDGNAERLLIFQTNVRKARERVIRETGSGPPR
jgi:hypothetical protein